MTGQDSEKRNLHWFKRALDHLNDYAPAYRNILILIPMVVAMYFYLMGEKLFFQPSQIEKQTLSVPTDNSPSVTIDEPRAAISQEPVLVERKVERQITRKVKEAFPKELIGVWNTAPEKRIVNDGSEFGRVLTTVKVLAISPDGRVSASRNLVAGLEDCEAKYLQSVLIAKCNNDQIYRLTTKLNDPGSMTMTHKSDSVNLFLKN